MIFFGRGIHAAVEDRTQDRWLFISFGCIGILLYVCSRRFGFESFSRAGTVSMFWQHVRLVFACILLARGVINDCGAAVCPSNTVQLYLKTAVEIIVGLLLLTHWQLLSTSKVATWLDILLNIHSIPTNLRFIDSLFSACTCVYQPKNQIGLEVSQCSGGLPSVD